MTDDGVAESSSAKKSYSPDARRFLSGFETNLRQQERETIEEEKQPEIDEEERVLQLAINGTLDELLSLNPDKDGSRIDGIASGLREIGPKASEAIVQMLEEERPARHRRLLLRALAAFGDGRAATTLYEYAVKSDDNRVRSQAMASLKEGTASKNSSTRKALVGRALADVRRDSEGDQDVKLKRGAISVLGALGGDDAVDEIASVLRTYDDVESRKEAVSALSAIGSDSAINVLYDVLDSDAGMRMDAARVLGSFREEEIELELGRLLADPEGPAEMRLAAVEGLGADNSTLAREILIKALRDKNQPRDVHQSICNALAGGFSEKDRGELVSYVQVFEKTPVDYLPQMMQPLLARGGDEAVDLLARSYMNMKSLKKIHAIRTLGRVQSEHAFDTLMAMRQREGDAGLRRELLSIIRRFKGERYEESVVKLLKVVAQTSKDSQSRIAALKNLGEVSPEEASSLASEMLFSANDADIVLVSIDVLKKYGNSDNGRVLAQFASMSEKDEVVKRAEVAMNEIRSREAK
jgi:HEAT repeat protein